MASKTNAAKRNEASAKAFLDAMRAQPAVLAKSIHARAILAGTNDSNTLQKLANELSLGPISNGTAIAIGVAEPKKIIQDASNAAAALPNTAISSSSGTTVEAGGQIPKVVAIKTSVTSGSKWPTSAYKYNLPPHKWTRLSRPGRGLNRDDRGQTISVDSEFNPIVDLAPKPTSIGTSRRGLIWWYSSQTSDINISSDSITTDSDDTKADRALEKSILIDNNSVANRQFGFMFLWNPTSVRFDTNVITNVSSIVDDYTVNPGAPGAQKMSLQLTLNRQDDFACLAGLAFKKGKEIPELTSRDLRDIESYYTEEVGFGSKIPTPTRNINNGLQELAVKGTLHDIEYLYRCVNGKGWKMFGIPVIADLGSADIGFLMPTIVNIAVGPMVYSGLIESLSVEHGQFTQNMTPIISTVSMVIDIRSSAVYGVGKTGGEETPADTPTTPTDTPAGTPL